MKNVFLEEFMVFLSGFCIGVSFIKLVQYFGA